MVCHLSQATAIDPLSAVPTAVARCAGALAALAHVGVQGKVHRFKFEHDLLGGSTNWLWLTFRHGIDGPNRNRWFTVLNSMVDLSIVMCMFTRG